MRHYGNDRRRSTIERDNRVIKIYSEVMAELGSVAAYVARTEIYRRVAIKVGLCPKTVANIINRVKRYAERLEGAHAGVV